MFCLCIKTFQEPLEIQYGNQQDYIFSFLQQDCLVKQGLSTQQSDVLLTNVNKLANTVNFDIRLAMNFIQDQVYIVLFILILHVNY